MMMALLEQIKRNAALLPEDRQIEVLNFISILSKKQQLKRSSSLDAEQIKSIKEAFKRLTEIRAFKEIDDPVAWQRETRKDKSLPGREA
jgi:hypothetical protein